MADIFISYARGDRNKVERLAAGLKGRGYSIWWDRDIQSGSEFSKSIEKELLSSKAVIVAWSAEANDSRWVKDEAEIAANENKLLAIALDAELPPIGFRQYHAVDFSKWNGDIEAPAFQNVARAVAANISGEPPEVEKAAPPKSKENRASVSICVLPFVNMSADPEQEYFSDGVTEDIITDLSLIPGLFVIARNSTFTYKGKSVNLRRLGKELDVRYVLEGSVRKSGNELRVTARLVEAASSHHLWAKKYDRNLEDVFAVQDELTREIVTALDVELVSGERGKHLRRCVKNPEAREALYRGMTQFYRFDSTSHAQAKMFFEEFTRLEPDSVLGYVWQAQLCQVEIFMDWSEDKDSSLKNMEMFVAKALKIDDRDPLALGHAGMHQLFLGNHDQSIAFAKRALVEAPGMDSPHYSLGWFQMFNGTPLEGIENLKRAMRLSPVMTAPRSTILGTAYRNAGQLELAVAVLEDTVSRFPAFISGRVALTSCYVAMGKEQEAKQEAREILQRDPTYTVARYTTPNLYRNKETMEKWGETLRKAGIPG